MKTLPPALLAAAVLMIGAAPVHAQVRGSEHALVQQTVDGTTITVDYSRPQIRGRTPAFGRMVDFGHEWTPGANWATIIEFDKPVKMNGRSIEAGRYSMWMTAQPDEFEIMLDPTDSIFHTMRPAPHDAQIRIKAPATDGPEVEVLTFSFPVVRGNGAELLFQWGAKNVVMDIEVEPTQQLTVDAETAAPFPGTYHVEWVAPFPREVLPPAERFKQESTMTLAYADEIISGWWDNLEVTDTEVMMVPMGEAIFHPGWMKNGDLFETDMDLWFEFTVENGVATGFQVRLGLNDAIVFAGTRVE